MPRYPRNYLETSYFHVMTQGINKNYIFDDSIDIKYYIKLIYKLKNEYDINCIAYCIMNNHAHLLIQIDKIEKMSKFMHKLNTIYSKYYNKKYNKVGYVFRNRYQAEGIYSEVQLYNCKNYIFNNPVKAGMCSKANEYPYSNCKISVETNINNKFIDIKEDTESIKKTIIENFLKENRISINILKYDEDKLIELIKLLKDEYKISLREISNLLNMGRETIRKKYQK